MPQSGVISLQKAFYVNGFAEIQGTLEKGGEAEPIPSAPYREDLMPKVPLSTCSVHSRELEFYCETCSVVICAHCTVKEHRGHHFELKDAKVSESRGELLTHIEPINKKLRQLLKVLEVESILIVDQRSSLEAQIKVMIEISLQEMRSKKANLIDEVYRNAQEKLQKMLAMKKKILNMQGEVQEYASVCDEELVAKDQVDATKAKITACIQKVADSKLPISIFSRSH